MPAAMASTAEVEIGRVTTTPSHLTTKLSGKGKLAWLLRMQKT
jgi:hypothetical protein